MKAIMKAIFLTLLGAMFGIFMLLLLPVIYVAWLSWREHERRVLYEAARPHRCDGGMENLSPTETRTARRPDPEKEPGLYALWEADQQEQHRRKEAPDHAKSEHPFFVEWAEAERQKKIDGWIRRAVDPDNPSHSEAHEYD